MELLKKRDIKRYRKEMRKIKKDVKAKKREESGLPLIAQPKPIRAPEEIKEIKEKKFDKMKNRMAQADFANAVKDGEDYVESAVAFLNDSM